MSKPRRLLGLPNGDVDTVAKEITFSLALADGSALDFVATQGIIEQIISALAPMAKALRGNAPQTVSAEEIKEYTVQRDAFGGPDTLSVDDASGGAPHVSNSSGCGK